MCVLGVVLQLGALTVRSKGREETGVAGSGLGAFVLREWPPE